MTSAYESSGTDHPEKYHALIIDSGAIIKQTAFTQLHNSSTHFYTVPAVLNEVRDAKSRRHLEEFQLRLASLPHAEGRTLQTRLPSQNAIAAMSEFARKTGDYPQLSGVDLQVLALLYDLECEACAEFGNGVDHIRREPKRVLGVCVKALNGDGKRVGRGNGCGEDSVASGTNASGGISPIADNSNSFFEGNADGIIDAAQVDFEYDEDDFEEDVEFGSRCNERASNEFHEVNGLKSKKSSWAMLVNPKAASTAPPLNYSLASSSAGAERYNNSVTQAEEKLDIVMSEHSHDILMSEVHGQFDDASENSKCDDSSDENQDSDDEFRAIEIANADSDEDISDEECDVFILEPHEAAYFKKLRERMMLGEHKVDDELVENNDTLSRKILIVDTDGSIAHQDDAELDSEFPSLAAAASVAYDGSDDENEIVNEPLQQHKHSQLMWEQEEEERKKKALEPMINGRIKPTTITYNSFRKYGSVVSSAGSAVSLKKAQAILVDEKGINTVSDASTDDNDDLLVEMDHETTGHKSRIMGAGGTSSALDAPTEMTAADDDGEGWVTSSRDIKNIQSAGSFFSQPNNSHTNNLTKQPTKSTGPPTSQRAACATTDFAMQNVILQMNLELLTVDGVRVRRLKTWVTRCAACFTIYGGNNDEKGKCGGRLFCDKCGSNTLQRIAASVDRNTGRLKLHMKKNYQYNTRGSKFSLPKAGKGNKYEGDLLLAEDQLMYGAWAQKVRKGKSKSLGESMFGSDLASDLGCHLDLTKRDDIKVGFGRRNPNSSKFGRERRGKKKSSADKACGLRRY